MSGCGDNIIAGNRLTNQRPASSGKSLEHDDMLIRSEGYLGESQFRNRGIGWIAAYYFDSPSPYSMGEQYQQ